MKIIIASGPVIIENNKVLLNQHGDDVFWKFPGGRVEDFDFDDQLNSLEQACRREVEEELGIKIKIIRPLKPMMLKKDDSSSEALAKDENTQVVLIHYLANRLGKITPSKDIREWAWHDIRTLPNNCAPNIEPVIAEYLQK